MVVLASWSGADASGYCSIGSLLVLCCFCSRLLVAYAAFLAGYSGCGYCEYYLVDVSWATGGETSCDYFVA